MDGNALSLEILILLVAFLLRIEELEGYLWIGPNGYEFPCEIMNC